MDVDRLWTRLLCAIAASVVCLLLAILAFLIAESWSVISHFGLLHFLNRSGWHPTEGQFGMTPMLIASFLTAIGAILIAAPIGIFSALFSEMDVPIWLVRAYRKLLSVLVGIPSVVYGFWGLTVLVPFLAKWREPGASLLAGILVLALMVVPTVALTTEAALAAVPRHYFYGAHALGFCRSAIFMRVILPAASKGIFSGLALGLARALGETMAVVMVTGNIVQIPLSLFDPVRTLTGNIALEMAYAVGAHRSALYVSGLMLIASVTVLVVFSQRALGKADHA